MNVKVITRHSPSNYGSLLQSIATVKTIEGLGHDCSIIDYQRPDERGLKGVLTQVNCKAGFGNPLKKLAYIAIRYPIEKFALVRFDRMRKKYLKMTSRCSSHVDLKKISADAFITGSDQVWGPMMNGVYDSAYFLQFVGKDSRKLAYAASFGKTKFDESTVVAYKKMLSEYDKIAVREKSAVSLLEEWGLNNCLGQVLDPTLLLDMSQWTNLLIKKNDFDKYKDLKYILVYQIHNDPKLSGYAKRLAKHTGMELLRVNPMLHQALRGGKFICSPDLSEFLSLVANASCIVTDSFHGTCFSINFGKQFIEILPNNATGTRNQSILELTGLSDRILCDFNDYSLVDKVIDYSKVNELLEVERRKSLEVIRSMIQNSSFIKQ
ncbi:polysaccharide pyruvyl transferase family protein [Segatella copri]|jgi:polysaccharide pyruvyl transferase WcaK-like protein|uniref:Polysaccharide pyruvyl transferase family protein n=1 Tax=Segatella copri TaxID=165179 RepID=A0AAW5UDP7_9BACT|nr:polysaccharide pyruvyl transferase family protein [Segatella copri]MCW4137120.1 polysaccharide pyruvyl transferase family protein [Segatella copri]MCW4142772.1 polysaccharide pyruvyl transferase family protein [Segatella copri]MCW4167359.1 polysaccharide pyruvyl transferase family protein [Segatella copri]HBJ04698.1 polysaccharide pyruvyl transferase family protein [Prevotella sp.]